ncbi:MAG: hypothetical protein IJ011_09740 [Clostridia bacterium]|nr:hypothetical protein [Clostridia bacterium]
MAYSVIVVSLAVLLLAAAVAYPYISGMVMKSAMLRALRVTARKAGFRCRRSFKNIFLVRNRSARYDMVIYNEKKLYAVKLWSSYFSYNMLHVMRDGRIKERRRTRSVFKMSDNDTVYTGGFAQRVPKTRLAKKYAKGREVVERILLIYPSYERIAAESGKGLVTLKTGDELFGKIIYSPSAFMNKLKADGDKETK